MGISTTKLYVSSPNADIMGMSCHGEVGSLVTGSVKSSWKAAVPKAPDGTVLHTEGGTTTGLGHGTQSFVSAFFRVI